MTDVGVRRIILVTALKVEMQGMIAENKRSEMEGKIMPYGDEEFNELANRIDEVAHMHDDNIMNM